MIIIQVAGGLGNQLQQYALYQKFLALGKQSRLDLSWFDQKAGEGGKITGRSLELSKLEGIAYQACTQAEKRALTGGDGIAGKLARRLAPFMTRRFLERGMYHPEIFALEDCYLEGYFACEKYYADILDRLRQQIRFPQSRNPQNAVLAAAMEKGTSVSVHIRRGDYKNPQNAAMFGNICTPDYYRGAMDYVKKQAPDARFYLFSDDIPYVRKHFLQEGCTVVDVNHGGDNHYDMWLMSRCRHNICANSTFSFWGARLNGHPDKIMVRPTVHKNSQVFVKEEMEELWKGWHFVDPQGRLQ